MLFYLTAWYLILFNNLIDCSILLNIFKGKTVSAAKTFKTCKSSSSSSDSDSDSEEKSTVRTYIIHLLFIRIEFKVIGTSDLMARYLPSNRDLDSNWTDAPRWTVSPNGEMKNRIAPLSIWNSGIVNDLPVARVPLDLSV